MTTRRAAIYAAAALVVAGAAVPSFSAAPLTVTIKSMSQKVAANTDKVAMKIELTGTMPSGATTWYFAELHRSTVPTDIVAGTIADVTLQDDHATTVMNVTFDLAPASPLGGTQPKAPGSYDLDIRWQPGPAPSPVVQGGCTKCFTVTRAGTSTVTGTYPDVRPRAATAAKVGIFGSGFTKGMRAVISKPGQRTAAPGFVVAPSVDTAGATNANERISTTELDADVIACPDTATAGCTAAAALGDYDVAVYNADGFREGSCSRCFTVGTLASAAVAPTSAANTGPVELTLAVTPAQAGSSVQLERAGVPAVTATNVTAPDATHLKFTVDTKYLPPDVSGKPKWSLRVTSPGGTGLCFECLTMTALSPTLTALRTNRVETDRTTAVTLTGTNIARGARLTFSKTGITATPVAVSSTGVATTTLDVDKTVTSGAVDVTLVNTDGKTTTACAGCATVIRETRLAITAPAAAPYGSTVTFDAKLVDAEKDTFIPNFDVRLLALPANALDWTTVGTAKTNDAGLASWELPLDGTTTYRVEFDGGDSLGATASQQTLTARGSVSLSAPRNGATVSTRPTFSGRVLPGAANVRIVELRNGTPVLLDTAAARNGAWRITVSLPAGRHTVYVELLDDESYTGARTTAITLTSR
jgi:hypothetical protein